MIRPLLLLALVCHLVFATTYAVSTPAFEGPDENAHGYYVSYLVHTGKLPVIVADCSPMTGGAAAHHPPLYYATLAGLTFAFGTGDYTPTWRLNPEWLTESEHGRQHFLHGYDEQSPISEEVGILRILRGFSVLCGLFTIWLAHALGRALFPHDLRIADVGALLLACTPTWSWMHGCLDNGNLAATLATATLVILVRAVQRKSLTNGVGAALGTVAGLALITKLTALFLLPIMTAGYLYGLFAWRQDGARRRTVISAMVALVTLAAVAGWSFWRNVEVYGDPFMLEAIEAPLIDNMLADDQRWDYLIHEFPAQLFGSSLASFGWARVELPAGAEWLVLAVILLAAGSCLKNWRKLCPEGSAALLLTVMAIAIVVFGVTRLNAKFVQPQGRYMFPAFAAFAVMVAAGLVSLWRARRLPTGLGVALLALPIAGAIATYSTVFTAVFPGGVTTPDTHYATYIEGLRSAPNPERETIELLAPEDGATAASSPTFRWRDPDAPEGALYSVHLATEAGIPLATFELGSFVITGDEWTMAAPLWQSLDPDSRLTWKIRRVPDRSRRERAADAAESAVRTVVHGG